MLNVILIVVDMIWEKVEKYGIIIESWHPIGHGDKTVIDNEIITKLGKQK